jgi:hypothetical protein
MFPIAVAIAVFISYVVGAPTSAAVYEGFYAALAHDGTVGSVSVKEVR